MAAELEHALNELRRLGEEKGAYDALVVENVRISAEKERAENDLAILEERLKGAEDLIEKLRHELDVEHSGLEVLVARTEELLGGGDAVSDERRTLLENQSLKCQVALLSGKLEREQDFSSALKSHVQCLVSRDKVLQKTVKDLTNRLLSSGEKLRKSLEKCRETNLALMKSSAQAECLEAELKRLKEGLLGSSFASKEDHREGPFESEGVPGPFDEKTPVCEHGDSFASYPNSVVDSYNLEGSVQEACSVELVDRLRVELDVKEKLSGEWRDKYMSIFTSETDPQESPAENMSHEVIQGLKKHLECASEAEQLINSFHNLSDGMRKEILSTLEETLHLYHKLSKETNAASELERYRSLYEQLSSGAPLDLESLHQKQDLQLKTLRASLEERFSQEKTLLLSEQVTRTKELLNRHEADLKAAEESAEARMAAERRRWMEELDVLRSCFLEKEEEGRKREAKMADDMAAIVNRHGEELQKRDAKMADDVAAIADRHNEELQKLCAALEEERRKTELLRDTLGVIEQEREQLGSLTQDIQTSSGEEDFVAIVQSVLEENKRLKDDVKSVRAEYEGRALKIQQRVDEVEAQYKQKVEELVLAQSRQEEVLKAKDEDMQLLRHELEHYADSVEALKQEHEAQLQELKERLRAEYAELAGSLNVEGSDIGSLKDALHTAIESVRCDHETEIRQIRRNLDTEHNLIANSIMAQYDLDLEALKNRYEGQLSALREQHSAELQRLASERVCAVDQLSTKHAMDMQQLKLDLEGYYNEVVASLRKEGAAKVKELEERLQNGGGQKAMTTLDKETETSEAEIASVGELTSAGDANEKEGRKVLNVADPKWDVEDSINVRSRHTAQTNTRLLNVLSDLVKTYVDTEQDIQDALAQLGLSRVDSPDSTAVLDEDYSSLGAVSSQTHGSKEDFAEGFLSELCEDGPDLTPRTWDMFASAIGMQETAEMEGEDVVLGASRRLRTAVDRVLKLLGEVAEHRGEDFRSLVQRNRDLCQELRQESQLHNQLCMDLINAQGTVRSLELEKQKLEETVFALEESRAQLERELRFAKAKVQRLEDAQDDLAEERLLLREQRSLLQEGLQEPQLRLLEEHTRLSEEKRQLQRSQDQEKQGLLCRVGELEAALEEACLQREEVLEMRRQELADLQAQIDAMDKQLLSHKKFIEEQTHEREQEREESAQEICQLQEALRDKEKIQNCEQRLSKEIECLEQQLKMRLEDHALVQRKRDQLEDEVRSRDDKIHDLRDIIRDLESELATRSRAGHELTQARLFKVSSLQEALAEAERAQAATQSELERMKGGSLVRPDLHRHVQQLEEQLESRSLELEKMAQFQSLLLEFRTQTMSTSTGVETELTLEQVGRLEEALYRVDQLREEARETTAELEDLRATCKIHKNDIQNLNAAQAKLAEDFEEVHSILEEREQEILELQQEAETQVVLEAEVQSLRDSLAQCRQAHAEELAMLQRELQRCQQAHEADVHRLHQHMEEAQCLHAQVQETLRQEVVALRDRLLESMPRDEATAALNKAVAVERENQQTKHHEEIRLLEETWSGRLDAERQRLQREQLQKQTDLERKYQQHARAHSWNRTDFEKEMAAQLEHEMAVLNVQHQNTMEGARRHWDEEKRALRVAHAEELQHCLEQLRASLAKAHQEEVAELKRRMRDAAKQHEAEMQRAAKSWEERIGEERRAANEGTRGHPDAELAELWSRGDVREFLGRRVNEEVSRLQQLHVHEVAVLRKALEKREADAGVEATSLRLEQEHTTEVARLRSEMAEMLREEEQALNAKAAQHVAAAEAEFRLEKERLVEKHSEEMRRVQAEFERESSARDAAHREQLQRVETNVKGILEAERGSARLQREQLVWKLQGQHADEVKALKCAHQRELASVKDELDRAKLKLRARKISALVQSRGGTPVSDNGSSSVGSGGTLEDRGSQDSVLSPPLRNLLNKIYRDQLHTTMETQHLHQQLLRERAQHMQMVKELQQEIALHREQAGQKERKLRDRGESQEGQLRLERARSEELQRCLDAEVSKSLELLSQLNAQRSSAMELEMALASSRSDLMDARRKILAAKQDVLHFK
ncbi:conserved hypothetical protein [Ixodes scapularis]|uniref:Pericentrin n=1 Tax=Ixodes scapularis TaxID=6945 RepID=B7QIX9_IXOSC|nr:conserved hypothetical protein [Ixodes scapularis]|eukprot:XP_002415136.1 conserved hypothetical protein [Ixodes scapularis]